MHTAVIIPSRAGGDDAILRWTLEGYQQQQLSPANTLEIRVGLDGAIPQGLIKSETTPAPDVRLTTLQLPPSGAAAVRNALIHDLRADLVIFGNADARPDPDMVQQHIDMQSKIPQGCMVLGSAPWEKPASPTVFDALLAETPMVFFYNQLTSGQWYDFRHTWTLNLSARLDDFRAVGGFHDLLRPVYYEDLAFGHRLLGNQRKGILYHPAARVLHRHPTTLHQYLDREELLGLMAPVLARVCPEAFAALLGTTDAATLAQQYRTWTTMDRSLHEWIYRRLQEWADLPASALPAGESRQQTLMTIYQMHIPLKRLAFRLGFLRGLDLLDDSRWQERKPQSLWKQIVVP